MADQHPGPDGPVLVRREVAGRPVRFVAGDTPAGTVVMLPDRLDDRGQPVFHDDAVGVVKTLRAHGHRVQAATTSRRSEYVSEYGAAADIASSIALGVAGNLTYDTLKTIVELVRCRVRNAVGGASSAVDPARVEVSIDELTVTPAGVTSVRGFQYTGPVSHLSSTLAELLPSGDPPGGHGVQ